MTITKLFKTSLLPAFILTSLFFIASCGGGSSSSNNGGGGAPITQTDPVTKIIFEGSTAVINFNNLQNNDIFLVKVNVSDQQAAAAETGGIISTSVMQNITVEDTGGLASDEPLNKPRRKHFEQPEALPFLPALIPSPKTKASDPYHKKFWVQDQNKIWRQIDGYLCAEGTYNYVWVETGYIDNNSSHGNDKLSCAQAKEVQVMFDKIYPLETALLGHEYGGDPSDNATYGGIDNDPKIHILIYDIDYDYSTNQEYLTYGYFWSKDAYTQGELDAQQANLKSNESEIFYMDLYATNVDREQIYLTLIHEFQHMINFNRKEIIHRLKTATWYNETLSVTAEAIIGPHPSLGISSEALSGNNYIAEFNTFYDSFSYLGWNDNFDSYSRAFVFGKYLTLNYGGAKLMHEILFNEYVDMESVGSALGKVTPATLTGTPKVNFNSVFSRFGEAIIYSGNTIPNNVNTIDKTVSNTIFGNTYTFLPIDIWSIARGPGGNKGPLIQNTQPVDIPGYGLSIEYGGRNISGEASITISKPGNDTIDLYIMVK